MSVDRPALPAGWQWASLGTIADLKLGKMLSPKAYAPGLQQLPYLRNENVRWFSIDTDDVKLMGFTDDEMDKYRLQVGDLLVCEGGEPGRCAVVTEDTSHYMIQKALHRVRPHVGVCDSKFLQYFFSRFIASESLIERRSETTIKHLPREKMVRISVPLPPHSEQQLIVAKVEELFSDLDAGAAALERVLLKLKRYRASVLYAAVTGKLTEKWRKLNPVNESAVKLLARILDERRKKWEAEQLHKFTKAGKTPPKGWKDKYTKPVSLHDDELPELPQNWQWVSLDTVTQIAGGITKGQKHDLETRLREIPYLRVANVQRGRLDLEEMKTIPATEDDIASLRLIKGDILFNEGGDRDKLGRGWVWNEEIPECIHQNHVFRARPLLPELQPKFISHHGNSFGQRWFQRTGKQSVNLASINMGVLRRFPVPLPPSAEQKQIMVEVERRLSGVDGVETEIEHSLKRAARLRQAILKRAFEGKLVPQDLCDEQAAARLAKFNVEADGVTANRKKRAKETV